MSDHFSLFRSRISEIFHEITATYRAYHNIDAWEETIVKLNNGECLWVAMLAAHIMKERYGETCHVMCSPSHYFIVYDNNHFDTLYPNGSIFELDEVFYQYARSAELIGNFNLQPWDGDIYHIVLQCCKRFEVEPLLFSGTVPDGAWEAPEIPKDIAFTLDQFYPVEVSYRTDGERAKVTHVKPLYN